MNSATGFIEVSCSFDSLGMFFIWVIKIGELESSSLSTLVDLTGVEPEIS